MDGLGEWSMRIDSIVNMMERVNRSRSNEQERVRFKVEWVNMCGSLSK